MNAATATDLRSAVENVIEHMATGKVLEAMETFYDDGIVMQENNAEATVGLAANIEREKQFLAAIKEWQSLEVQSIGTHGDTTDGTALIEYSFDFINTDDQPVRYEQVSVQTWKNGKITKECFYYNAGACGRMTPAPLGTRRGPVFARGSLLRYRSAVGMDGVDPSLGSGASIASVEKPQPLRPGARRRSDQHSLRGAQAQQPCSVTPLTGMWARTGRAA